MQTDYLYYKNKRLDCYHVFALTDKAKKMMANEEKFDCDRETLNWLESKGFFVKPTNFSEGFYGL